MRIFAVSCIACLGFFSSSCSSTPIDENCIGEAQESLVSSYSCIDRTVYWSFVEPAEYVKGVSTIAKVSQIGKDYASRNAKTPVLIVAIGFGDLHEKPALIGINQIDGQTPRFRFVERVEHSDQAADIFEIFADRESVSERFSLRIAVYDTGEVYVNGSLSGKIESF